MSFKETALKIVRERDGNTISKLCDETNKFSCHFDKQIALFIYMETFHYVL